VAAVGDSDTAERRKTMTGIVVPDKAVPRGTFPHAKRSGDFIFVSGTSSRRPDNSYAGATTDADGTLHLDIREQTRAVIDNIAEILGAAGASLEHLVEITTFLVDMADFDGYNEVYAEYFDYQGPTRTTVAVRELPHPHLLIEIKAIACKPE